MDQPPLRRAVLAVTVALLIVTAGCTGLSGDGAENSTATPTTNATVTPAANGSADNQSATSDNVTTVDLDGQQLTSATADNIVSAGSYTAHSNTTAVSTGPQGVSQSISNGTVRVDFDARRGVRVGSQTIDRPTLVENRSTAVYTDGTTSYRRQNTSQGVTYDSQTGDYVESGDIVPVNVTSLNRNYTIFTNAFVWTENGTETVDGVTTTRYTIVGISNSGSFTGNEDTSVQNASGAMLVDSDDTVRQVSLEYSVTTDTGTVTITTTTRFTDIGSTTVSEPSWVSAARESE